MQTMGRLLLILVPMLAISAFLLVQKQLGEIAPATPESAAKLSRRSASYSANGFATADGIGASTRSRRPTTAGGRDRISTGRIGIRLATVNFLARRVGFRPQRPGRHSDTRSADDGTTLHRATGLSDQAPVVRRRWPTYHAAMKADSPQPVSKIVSGGQTGVDQGALDAAIWLGIEHGGWCPKGRRSEAGQIPRRFDLSEMETRDYATRTEQNVIDSDGTLILFRQRLSGGTAFTKRMAQKHARPFRAIDLTQNADLAAIRAWFTQFAIQTLNVAGPRESSAHGISDEARAFW